MICPKCNNEISDDSVFCPKCGYKTGGDASQETAAKEKKPINKKLAGGIAAAVVVVAVLGIGIYINSTPESKYNKAEKAFEKGDYEKAIKYYTAVGDYEDAADKLVTAELAEHYALGVNLMDNGSYEDAKLELEQADGYNDAVDLIKQCDYKIAENYVSANDYLAAAESFKNAGNYEDANDRIMSLGQELVSASNYSDAVKVYEYADDWSADSYAQYANGMINLEAENYFDAATCFQKAGNILDAKDKFNESQYTYASELLKSRKYSGAKYAFRIIQDYKDASNLISACELMSAKGEMDEGNLNTAKEALEKLPRDCSYDNVSVSELLDKLDANSQWLAICGKWTSTGGQMRSTQSGSYGYSNWWYHDFEKGEENLDVRCKLNDDGSVTIMTSGKVQIYTNYSAISAGLKWGRQSLDINEKVSNMGTVKVDDLTTISFSSSKITVSYKKVDRSQDVYFTYTYKTDITYGERTAAY